MKLITRVNLEDYKQKIGHKDSILMLGSCFAINIGEILMKYKFKVSCNPCGITYNPISLIKLLDRISTLELTHITELKSCQDFYCHPGFHGQFNQLEQEETMTSINEAISSAHSFVKRPIQWLSITLGTAYVYRRKSDGLVVNNCHKFPKSDFDRVLLSAEEIKKTMAPALYNLQQSHPSLNILFTVSPIRHIRDGLVENNRSKATLLQVVHDLVNQNESYHYFPAYELMMDELRDYRFYEADLIHPNQMAIQYLWEKFSENLVDLKSQDIIKELDKIQKNLAHKPFLKNSKQYDSFLDTTKKQMDDFLRKYPEVSLEAESEKIKQLKLSE